MFIQETSGNVGIGTTSPSARLQVASPTATSVVLATNYSPTHASHFFEAGIVANDGYLTLRNSGVVSTVHIDSDGDSYFNGGNVGIGTTGPAYKLDVAGNARIGSSSQTTTSFYLTATNTAGAPAIAVQTVMQGYEGRGMGTFYTDTSYSGEEWFNGINYAGGFDRWSVGYDQSGGQAEYLANAKFTVFHDGKVGIGTTNPSEKLHVVGSNIRLDSNSGGFYKYTAGGGFRFALFDDSSKTHLFADGDGSNPYMTFNAGFVGIGTENPAAELDVFSASSFRADVATGNPLISIVNNTAVSNTAGTATIKFTQGNTQAGGKIVSARDGNYSSGATRTSNLQFYTSTAASDTEKMRITSAGNVGIGTTNPIASYDKVLNIQGSNPTVKIQTTSSSGWAYNQYVSPEATWSAGILDTDRYVISQSSSLGTNVRFTIDDATNGNVGIGIASPTQKLQVAGNALLANGSADINLYLGNSDYGLKLDYSAGDVFVRTSGGNRIVVKNNGDVGIGVAPVNNYRLEVYDGDYTQMMLRAPTYPSASLQSRQSK